MKAHLVLLIMIGLLGCAGAMPVDHMNSESDIENQSDSSKEPDVPQSAGPVKSPHGYIITKDYEPGRFGGFIGDCADDQNWPYYWECQSENAGDGGFQ
jgi:hypothetical protein